MGRFGYTVSQVLVVMTILGSLFFLSVIWETDVDGIWQQMYLGHQAMFLGALIVAALFYSLLALIVQELRMARHALERLAGETEQALGSKGRR